MRFMVKSTKPLPYKLLQLLNKTRYGNASARGAKLFTMKLLKVRRGKTLFKFFMRFMVKSTKSQPYKLLQLLNKTRYGNASAKGAKLFTMKVRKVMKGKKNPLQILHALDGETGNFFSLYRRLQFLLSHPSKARQYLQKTQRFPGYNLKPQPKENECVLFILMPVSPPARPWPGVIRGQDFYCNSLLAWMGIRTFL